MPIPVRRAHLVHELFAEQARRAPEAMAVEWEGGRWTYGEVERRAERRARRLRRLGIGPGAVAAVLLERSGDWVVSLLAVLKVGAAYLPLDPAQPAERLDGMLADSGAAVVLVRGDLATRHPAGPPIVSVTENDEELGAAPATGPVDAPDPGPEDLAYVIFTSGSTGRPKGVLVPHGALAHHATATRALYGLAPDDRVLQFASPAFDVAAEEIFTTLASGAALVLRPDPPPESAAAFARFLERRRVTVVNLPASFWHAWVDELERDGEARVPACLRLVIAGSERVLAGRLAAWRRQVGSRVRWLNAYGPTEATITATVHEPRTQVREGNGPATVPIGRPLAGVRAAVLDAGLRPVPDGSAGELCLGGPTLACGYLGQPALTAERFVPDPAGGPGARLYRTGDRVRRRGDGVLEFLGRFDDQVKIRGFRIEPGEVEAALERHPGVARAVVVAYQVAPGDDRLIAYTTGGDPAPTAHALRASLRKRLPEPWVPAWFVRLDALPLSPSGKIDRRRLPPPPAGAAGGYEPPATATETALAGLFSDVLGVERVGAEDDFFGLGGHSLLATRLLARVRETFRIELPLPRLFAAPTVRALAPAVEGAVADTSPALPAIRRRPRPGPFPLSFPQERIWFLSRLAPESIAYNTQLTILLRGPLDVPALAAALSEIVRRHEVFRTSFEVRDGGPVQWVHLPAPVALPLVDVAGLPERARETEAEALLRRETRVRFDVARPPLVRWTLVRLGPRLHRLLQVEHHFVHDGWSLAVLFRELRQLYRAFAERRPSPLPELPVQFADFAAWQREWMQGEVLAAELAWWLRRLSGMTPALELPTDRPRPRVQSFRGKGRTLTLPERLFTAAAEIGRAVGATPFMVLLAAFTALLYRATGQDDVVVGSSVANRRLRESEDLIGMIVNNLVLRTSLAGNPAFPELVERVRAVALEAYAHQDVPFEKLVEALQPERDLGRNPLFQVAFGFHDSAMPDLDLGALGGTIEYTYNDSAKFDLNLVVVPPRGGEEVQLLWEYSTDLFDATTILRLHRRYAALLESIAAGPEARIGDLALLGAAERHQVLVEWNDAPAVALRPARVPELVAEQAARRCGALAVAAGGRRLTYGELADRAERLAHHLAALGVGPEVTVALLMERSPELVAAMLGVLAAGGAYLPLDPAYPPERLAFMLEDAAAPVVLVDEPLRGRLPRGLAERGVRVLALSPAWDVPAPASLAVALPRRPMSHAAYVIYTSGSTGRPKGVQVSHANLAHLVAWHRAVYGVTAADRATHLAGVAFDASVWEVWPYLAVGASLHLPDEETRATSPRLAVWLREEAITIAFLPTPLAEAVLDEPWPRREGVRAVADDPAPLRALLTGGDRLRRRPPAGLPFILYNHYGPTEGTVVATSGATAPAGERADAPSIGRAVPNAGAYLLEPSLHPAPIGVPAELCLGGRGVARGYLGRPDLTAERFVPDPVGGEPGGRVYRSGDLVRWRADGRIEFLGRADQQVKLRGYRVEPGEVEAALAEHPAVREAVVVVREVAPSEPRLVAYLVAGEEVAPEALADLCRRRLPDYMVPAAWVRLAALPLTPNGKLDRAALPAPEAPAASGAAPPCGPVEEAVARLFARAVGGERVGAQDSFFALGGHSLAATRLLFQLAEVFRVEVPLVAFFDDPTVAGLARALVAREARPGECEATARLLQEVEAMSAEQVAEMLGRHPAAGEGAAA